jgi:hypothetical protein
LPIDGFGATFKLRGVRYWWALTAGIENAGQPQTRQNNPTVFAMLHRNVKA